MLAKVGMPIGRIGIFITCTLLKEPDNRIDGRVAPAVKNMKCMVSQKNPFYAKNILVFQI